MSEYCIDGNDHEIAECPNCGCEFCVVCYKINMEKEKNEISNI